MQTSENSIIPITPRRGRKKIALPSEWQRQKEKRQRYSSIGFPSRPQCEHKNKNQQQYQCRTLTMQDVRRAHQMFYEIPDKIKQDEIILRFVMINPVRRTRSHCKDLFELSAIVPRYAKLGETVVLRCNHTVSDNQLYKVQWTKSGDKLFQYIRGRNPPYINHTIPGAKIDWDQTSASKLALMDVQHDASGLYACTITTESPIYSKTSEFHDLTVIKIQNTDPTIEISKEIFNVGDILDATCTSGPSKPVPEITWLVNGRKPPDTYMKPIMKTALDSTAAMRLTLPVSERVGAEVHLTCLSTIPGFLNQKAHYLDYADYRTSSIIVSVAAKSEPVTAGCGKEFISIVVVAATAAAVVVTAAATTTASTAFPT